MAGYSGRDGEEWDRKEEVGREAAWWDGLLEGRVKKRRQGWRKVEIEERRKT